MILCEAGKRGSYTMTIYTPSDQEPVGRVDHSIAWKIWESRLVRYGLQPRGDGSRMRMLDSMSIGKVSMSSPCRTKKVAREEVISDRLTYETSATADIAIVSRGLK